MTSGAIQQGVPTKVLRPATCWPHDPSRSSDAATPKSANSTDPSVFTRMLPACNKLPTYHPHDVQAVLRWQKQSAMPPWETILCTGPVNL
jgi:hypothetical protein